MEAEQETKEKLNSVEISINAKGQFSGKVKVYADTINEAMKLATLKAGELEIIIKEKNGEGKWIKKLMMKID